MTTTEYACGNCEWSGTEPVPLNETNTATEILGRFDVGGPFTDSECPDCGSLAYPKKPKVFRVTVNLGFQDFEADSKEEAEETILETILDTTDNEPDMVREWFSVKEVE